ncbi:hypothetical protein [Megasphaera massiliensis]|uniref:hypothetical protein n=1 Tax=Megasphaera massiliensis TaxID=1232428 RepID=UPI0034A55961
MSILKGILHHWNKTNKAYDTIHPETEVAQITDWNNGVVNTLASTALGSLVTTLSSDSLLAKLIGKVLTASGARYQSGPNGYICFGSYFGSHIIQWGNPITTDQAKEFTITLPLAARVYAIMLTDTSSTLYQALDVTMCWDRDNLDRVISAFRVKATFPPSTFNWLFIGRIN